MSWSICASSFSAYVKYDSCKRRQFSVRGSRTVSLTRARSNLSIPEMCCEIAALLAQLERDDLMHTCLYGIYCGCEIKMIGKIKIKIKKGPPQQRVTVLEVKK